MSSFVDSHDYKGAADAEADRFAEMWPQRQKEFEQLAKQRADLAAKFSIPSYSTDLSLASSFTSATGNAWVKLHDFGSTIGNGIDREIASIKPYTKYIAAAYI